MSQHIYKVIVLLVNVGSNKKLMQTHLTKTVKTSTYLSLYKNKRVFSLSPRDTLL